MLSFQEILISTTHEHDLAEPYTNDKANIGQQSYNRRPPTIHRTATPAIFIQLSAAQSEKRIEKTRSHNIDSSSHPNASSFPYYYVNK